MAESAEVNGTGRGRAALARMQRISAAHDAWRGGMTLNLNAASNVMSKAARNALSSRFADKGAAGHLGARRHPGAGYVDRMEEETSTLACELLGAAAVELRPPTGNISNGVVLAALLNPGDLVMALPDGVGHESHRAKSWIGRFGARVQDLPYDYERFDVDLDQASPLIRRTRPSVIIVGSQLLLFPYRLPELRACADEVGAVLMYDAAHALGLIAGGEFQNPLAEGAHVLTGSTQKSLPGPVGGLIATSSARLGARIADTASSLVSNYQNNRVFALGLTLAEMSEFGASYATLCVRNARALAAALAERGFMPLGASRGWTASSQVLLDLTASGHEPSLAELWAAEGVMTTPVELPVSAASTCRSAGIRLGVQEVTRRGLQPDDMPVVAQLLHRASAGEHVRDEVSGFVGSRPGLRFCFDERESDVRSA